jgi:hypothetical protein
VTMNREDLSEINPEMILYDDLEDAFVGVCLRYGQEPIALYDYQACIEIRMRDGATYEEAVEFHEYNTMGLYAGECTPAFVTTLDHGPISIRDKLKQSLEDIRDLEMQIECMKAEYTRLGNEHLKLRDHYKSANDDFFELKAICEKMRKRIEAYDKDK